MLFMLWGHFMLTFLALYRGSSANDAKMIAVSSDNRLVAEFAERLLGREPPPADPILLEVERGQRRALRLISHEKEVVDVP